MADMLDIREHESNFENYAAQWLASEERPKEPLLVKLKHSRKVLEKARWITEHETLKPELARACLLAALYHDVGRFEQYHLYGTFRDRESRNHAAISIQVLKKKGWLKNEPGRKLIMAAVCCHNRHFIPSGLSQDQKTACQLVRDADKLDILRVMDEHLAKKPYNPTVVLNLPDSGELSPAVEKALRQGYTAAYTDLRSVDDFRLLLGSWFHDMAFKSSRELFVGEGHATAVVAGIRENGAHAAARDFLLKKLAVRDL